MSQAILGQWRIRIRQDDGYETSIFDNPDSYTDDPGLQSYVLNGLRNDSLAGADVCVEICVPGGWEYVGGILTVIDDEFVGNTYWAAGEIPDSHIKELAHGLIDEYGDKLNNAPIHQLQALALKIGLQEGTGEVGGWDDPGLAMRLVELMKEARVTAV